MPDQTTTTTRTITLTDRPPVRIREDQWPIIAEASGDSWDGHPGDGRYHQARNDGTLDNWALKVRQHEDGRAIVYGVYRAARFSRVGLLPRTSTSPGRDRRGGELLDPEHDLDYAERGARAIVDAIRRVGDDCDLPDYLIRECIADLPPQEL